MGKNVALVVVVVVVVTIVVVALEVGGISSNLCSNYVDGKWTFLCF